MPLKNCIAPPYTNRAKTGKNTKKQAKSRKITQEAKNCVMHNFAKLSREMTLKNHNHTITEETGFYYMGRSKKKVLYKIQNNLRLKILRDCVMRAKTGRFLG